MIHCMVLICTSHTKTDTLKPPYDAEYINLCTDVAVLDQQGNKLMEL